MANRACNVCGCNSWWWKDETGCSKCVSGVVLTERDHYFLDMLKLVSTRTTCPRRRVGAIIVDQQGHILATGYNGVPSGFPHCTVTACPGVTDLEQCEAIHAEQNALLQCHRLDLAHTIYISCAPCFTCAKLIANTHIARVVCAEAYTDMRGRDILIRRGVQVDIPTD
jgi:dCMP deaminase